MPAHRKPVALLSTLKTNPGRFTNRGSVPEPSGPLGEPPAHLTPEEQAIWNQIVEIMPPGVLGDSDVFIVELAARLVQRARTQFHILKSADFSVLTNVLGRLGLTPADRQRLNASSGGSDEDTGGGFDEF